MNKTIGILSLLITLSIAMPSMAAMSTGSVTRSFPTTIPDIGENLTVTLTPTGVVTGGFYQAIETLPTGFIFVSTDADHTVKTGQTITFTKLTGASLTYIVTVPTTDGTYTFTGTFRDNNRDTGDITGMTTIIMTGVPASYDVNANGRIDKNEAVKAVIDYFNGIIEKQLTIGIVIEYFNDQIPVSTPAPIPTIGQPKILIEYNATSIDRLTEYMLSSGPKYLYPKTGMIFLVVNLKITNIGYSSVNINKFQWNLMTSTRDNPNTYMDEDQLFYGKEDDIECRDAVLENGGWTYCKIPFEVSTNWYMYKIFWYKPYDMNVEWKYVGQ